MNRPRLNNSLAPDNIISRMAPGKIYGAYALAAKFHVKTDLIRPALDTLVQAGRIELCSAQTGPAGFRRAKDQPPPAPPVETSIATPPVTVRMSGELSGYELDLRQRAALCMMVRK